MANYFSEGIAEVPFIADEDLSSWQNRLVMAASTTGYVQKHDILLTAASPRYPLGILTNDPSAGQEASVKVLGFAKCYGVVAGCTLEFGSNISASNGGNVIAASTSLAAVLGIWFGPAVTTGEALGNVLFIPNNPSGIGMLNSTN